MKNEMINATPPTVQKRIIGVGGSNSASIGEKIAAIFAPILHKPYAVPAKIAGKSYALARKQMSKVTLMPVLAMLSMNGTNSGWESLKERMHKPPERARVKVKVNDHRGPSQ